jgi:DNA-directed RNA polymerase subunit K/omega
MRVWEVITTSAAGSWDAVSERFRRVLAYGKRAGAMHSGHRG